MAGDWIKMRNNLWDDPRILRICDETDSNEAAVIGALYWLWATADQHSEDGLMQGMTLRSIDRKTGVQGFGNALVLIGWLAERADGVFLLRFDEHNGTSSKMRAQVARRVASHKANAKVTVAALPELKRTVTDALPREEERRKELTSTTPVGVDVASNACDSNADGTGKLDCPHQEIIRLYHDMLPQCPPVRHWTPARATQLRARWNEDPARQNLEYWRHFFEYIGQCDFLVGRSGKTPFFADLEWMTKAGNFTKIREQKYENRI